MCPVGAAVVVCCLHHEARHGRLAVVWPKRERPGNERPTDGVSIGCIVGLVSNEIDPVGAAVIGGMYAAGARQRWRRPAPWPRPRSGEARARRRARGPLPRVRPTGHVRGVVVRMRAAVGTRCAHRRARVRGRVGGRDHPLTVPVTGAVLARQLGERTVHHHRCSGIDSPNGLSRRRLSAKRRCLAAGGTDPQPGRDLAGGLRPFDMLTSKR